MKFNIQIWNVLIVGVKMEVSRWSAHIHVKKAKKGMC